MAVGSSSWVSAGTVSLVVNLAVPDAPRFNFAQT